MPTKFKKLIWIKRGDFIIATSDASEDKEFAISDSVSTAASSLNSVADTTKVQYIIKHILTKPQIKHIQDAGLWYSIIFLIVRILYFR